jgi:hypothetical protein
MYKSYSSLGGDGIITTLVTQTMALPVEEKA